MRTAKALLFLTCAALLTAGAQTPTRRPTQKPTPKPTPKPSPTPLPNEPPSVKLAQSTNRVVLADGCPEGVKLVCIATSPKVSLRAQSADPDGDTLLHTYSTTGGRIDGDGPEVTLDLTGIAPGVYTVTVEVDDGNGGIATDTTKVTVERCICDPPPLPPPPCPTVTVSCPDLVGKERHLTYKANVTGGDPSVTPTFNWTVQPGTITGGQGTSSITVDARGASHGVFTAVVEVVGYDRGCRTAASCSLVIEGPRPPRQFDEYGDIPFDDEKRRLYNLSEELRNDPTAQGYLLCYGGRRSRVNEARRRCERARKFLVNSRGMHAARIVTVDAGYREKITTEVWVVPSGATLPQATPTVDPKDVRPQASPQTSPRKARGRR